jgi:23S rRNA pseudouridine1911/1915/1917 synthase
MGDPVYGRHTAARKQALPPAAQAALDALARQALDAYLLSFTHPTSGEWLTFCKELPSDIKFLKDSLDKF